MTHRVVHEQLREEVEVLARARVRDEAIGRSEPVEPARKVHLRVRGARGLERVSRRARERVVGRARVDGRARPRTRLAGRLVREGGRDHHGRGVGERLRPHRRRGGERDGRDHEPFAEVGPTRRCPIVHGTGS